MFSGVQKNKAIFFELNFRKNDFSESNSVFDIAR